MRKTLISVMLFLFFSVLMFVDSLAQINNEPLITNIENRTNISLDGKWDIIIDPYENGYYNHKYIPKENGYFKNQKSINESELIEYNFDNSEKLNVPGDWNTQLEKLLYYEGTIWYKKSFQYKKQKDNRVYLYFGSVNYECQVYLNGQFIGEHIGGFTPFNFEISEDVFDGENFIVLMVNNIRKKDGVPTVNTDWWNYGGLTRSVKIIETPNTFIQDYFIQLNKNDKGTIAGWIQLSGDNLNQKVTILINELNISESIITNKKGFGEFVIKSKPQLWSPNHPKLYEVLLTIDNKTIVDKIGFRTISTRGSNILLNDKEIYLKGICIHEEAPFRSGRANNLEDARILLGWAKELGCNYVRLAHYPHNENMIKVADQLGLMIWSEVPVYWTIQWANKDVYNNAINQLSEMIVRDKNRASIILWSMANETPVTEKRNEFLKNMIKHTKLMDPTRLVTAALHTGTSKDNPNTIAINDPLGDYLDVIGINEYLGWYNGLPYKCDTTDFVSNYNKPVIISEFGGGALQGYFGDKLERWTENYQNFVYEKNLPMFDKIDFVSGMTPWLLMDFRSPRRPLPIIQDGWNRKGLISNKGIKKKAFYTLKKYYETK